MTKEELEKEISSLKDANRGLEIIASARDSQIHRLQSDVYGLREENGLLEAQIEKMKCCFNCSRFDTCSLHRPCRNYNEWKLRR